MNNLTNKLPFIIWGCLVLGIGATSAFFAFKGKFPLTEIIGLSIVTLWLLTVTLIDTAKKIVPFWLTAPVILLVLGLRFFEPHIDRFPLMGFGLFPFHSLAGLVFAFLVCDIINHFANCLSKLPPNHVGLIPLWVSLPLCLLVSFVPLPSMWLIPIFLVLARLTLLAIEWKNKDLNEKLKKVIFNHALTYGLVVAFIALFALLAYKEVIQEPFDKTFLFVFILGGAYILEEIILPLAFRIGLSKLFTPQENDSPSALGGGDIMLAACMGVLFGAQELNIVLILAIFLAFVYVIPGKLKNFIAKKNSSVAQEAPSQSLAFAPFMALSAQIILLMAVYYKFTNF
jgi:prepilin signal peptidase PulO-like enzyme (type II secretory pathway)